MKRALVLGAGGFIGGHLCNHLIEQGYTVHGVDIKPREKWWQAHGKLRVHGGVDLKKRELCDIVLGFEPEWDCVVQLACNMGGIGFISHYEWECIRSVHINQNLVDACIEHGNVGKYLYSSSACVYPDMGTYLLKEEDAWPAMPDHKYGLEKLFSEEYTLQAGKSTGLQVKVLRFHNIYGPYGSYNDGREKFPAAICRKVRDMVRNGERKIEMWGTGEQTRSYLYIDDCIYGITKMLNTPREITGPYNIGSQNMVTCNTVLRDVLRIAGLGDDRVMVNNVNAPVGVSGRGSDNTRVGNELGWSERTPLQAGLTRLYEWIARQP